MDALHQHALALRAIVGAAPTPALRAQISDALASKFEGLQAIALDALGAWGDEASLAEIQAFLRSAFGRKRGAAIRGVASRNLIPHLASRDVAWVLDLYFSLPQALEKHELLPLVLALPPEAAKARLVAAFRDPLPANRQAAVKAIGNMPYPDRAQLLRPLSEDPAPSVSKSARRLSQEV